MQPNILFDNIYIGHSVEDARKFAQETFFKKHAAEELAEQADTKSGKPKSPSDLSFLEDPVNYVKEKVQLFISIAQRDPMEAVKFVPEVAGGLAAIVVTLLAVIVGALSSGSATPAAKKVATAAKEKATEAKEKVADAAASGAEAVKGEATKRSTRSQQS